MDIIVWIKADKPGHEAHQIPRRHITAGPTNRLALKPGNASYAVVRDQLIATGMYTSDHRQWCAVIHVSDCIRRDSLGPVNLPARHLRHRIRIPGPVTDVSKPLGSQQCLGHICRRDAGARSPLQGHRGDLRWLLGRERSASTPKPDAGNPAHAGNARNTELTQETAPA